MIKLKPVILLLLISLFVPISSFGQDDLFDLFEDDSAKTTDYVIATFKTSRIVNGQSIEVPEKNEMIFVISHHFGNVSGGLKEFFGLDQSTVRLGFEYSPVKNFTLMLGRSSYQKTVDAAVKYKFLSQSKGAKVMPVSAVFYAATFLNTEEWRDPERDNLFSSRLSYNYQLLVARKFSTKFSAQLSPTYLHYNLVPDKSYKNDLFAMGIGGRYKLTHRIIVTAEYFYVPEHFKRPDTYNSLSFGFDFDTGGHIFQLYFSNSMAMFERGFIGETTASWLDGDFFFGFNITRNFNF